MTRPEQILRVMFPSDSTIWGYRDQLIEAMRTIAVEASEVSPNGICAWLDEGVTSQPDN